MKYLVYLLFILLSSKVANAQDPAHFKIGEKEFSNTNIYTLLYDDHFDVLYVGTDNGLYAYKQNKFVLLKRPLDQNGNSVFTLKQNSKGEVFCKNLNGQIFKVEGNNLTLFHQPVEKEVNSYFSYYFDKEDAIITQSKNVIRKVINGTRSSVLLHSESNIYWESPQTKNGDIYFFDSQNNVLKYSNSVFYKKEIVNQNEKGNIPRFNLNNKVYSVYDQKIEVTDSSTFYNTIKLKRWEVFYTLNDNLILGLDRKKGCRIIKMENDTLKEVMCLFNNTFISTVTENRNGVLFLGTFGEGIIVVPQKEVIKYDYKHLFLGIAVSPKNDLYLSSRGGEVFEYKNSQLNLIYERETNIDQIFYLEKGIQPIKGSYGLFVPSNNHLFIGGDDVVDAERFMAWSYFGGIELMMIQPRNKLDKESIYKNGSRRSIVKNKRCNAITYSVKDSLFYYSSSTSVFSKKWNSKSEKKVLFNGKPFLSSDLLWCNNQLICATSKHGVLFFENDKLVNQISENQKLKSNSVRKIMIRDNLLYILTNKGLQIYDLKQNEFIGLGLTEGMIEEDVANFTLGEDKLWVLHKHSFYGISLSELKHEKNIAQLYIDSIVVNKTLVDYAQNRSFSYAQNQFDFYFDYRDIESRSETKLLYTLEGFYTDWREIPTSENKIEFQSLPPGNYVFKIKGNYRNQETEVFKYAFEIKVPYWQRWWFYGLISLSFSFVLTAIFRTRLKRQKREARLINELNTSKLTAIQSQMNPHFIFNALNSIQALVLRGDVDNSYAYINEFSDLVRKTLNYSEKDVIPFEDELRLIKIYLNLENLRFRKDFEYTIAPLESDIDFSVPPMLIQPFIENALVHGLLHREGLKTIQISFELTDVLICTIKDNGVGRSVSKEINRRQNPNHESFATDAIQNRLKILSQRFENPIGFEYKDILGKSGEIIGTVTIINIPITIDF